MIDQDGKAPQSTERLDITPASATKEDLFGYGVAAKISGVEGRGTGEFALLVEGVARVRIDKLTQERPFFEAEVTYEFDEGIYRNLPAFEVYHMLISPSCLSGRHCYSRPLCTSKATFARAFDTFTTFLPPTSAGWLRPIPNTCATAVSVNFPENYLSFLQSLGLSLRSQCSKCTLKAWISAPETYERGILTPRF